MGDRTAKSVEVKIRLFKMQKPMLKKIKWKWLFTRKKGNGSMQLSLPSDQQEYHSGKWYQSIYECPLSVFIICICDGIVSPLLKSGKVPEQILQNAWQTIYLDYTDALISESEQAIIMMGRKIVLLEQKIAKAYAIHTVLSYRWSEEMETEFLRLGVVDSRYPSSLIDQVAWWKRAMGRIKRWEIEMGQEMKRKEQLLQSTSSATEKVTRDSFQDFIVQMEVYLKFSINETETTVARFISIVKGYQRHLIALSKANKK